MANNRTSITTLRLSAAILAIAATIALVLIYTLEAAAGTDVVAEPIQELLSIAVTVTIGAYVTVHCRDYLDQRLTDMLTRAVEEAGDRRATEARLDTIEKMAADRLTATIGRPVSRIGSVD